MQAGLFCGNQFPTLTAPLTSCAPSQYGSTLVKIWLFPACIVTYLAAVPDKSRGEWLGSPCSVCRRCRIPFMVRTAISHLILRGMLQLSHFRSPGASGARYAALWRLPRPDSHRLVDTDFKTYHFRYGSLVTLSTLSPIRYLLRPKTRFPVRRLHLLSGREFHPMEAPGLSWRAIVQKKIGQDWANHAPYTEGNFDHPGPPILLVVADPKESECCDE